MSDKYKNKTINLAAIAQAAGVSKMTVSRAFNRPHLLNKSTLNKITDIAETMGYIPDLAASGFITGATRSIGVIVPSLSDLAYSESLAGINEAADLRGYNIILGESRFCKKREKQLIRTFIGRKVEGLVLIACDKESRSQDIIESLTTPLLFLWDLQAAEQHLVNGFSNLKAGALVAEHFVKSKKQQLLVATTSFYRDIQRADGFISHAKKNGINANIVKFNSSTDDIESMFNAGKTLIYNLYKKSSLPDAIFFTDESTAFAALHELQRLKVPYEQCAVCGFGNTLFAKYGFPSLSTVNVAAHEMGLEGTNRLIDKMQGKSITDLIVEHKTTLILRESS